MKLREKAMLLLMALALGPVLGAVFLLINVDQRAARARELDLQMAVLSEVAAAPSRILDDVTLDAQAVAAIFGRAADDVITDDAAIKAASAIVSTRDTMAAVNLEVPSVKLSVPLRRAGSATAVPASSEELRRRADEHGVAFGLLGPGRGIVVARVPKAGEGPPGYVVADALLEGLAPALKDIAESRFHGEDVSLLIATQDGTVVASYGVPGMAPGGSVATLPVWAALPKSFPAAKVDIVSEHTDGQTPMVGALSTMPALGWAVAIWRPKSVAYASLAEMQRNGLLVAAFAAALSIAVALFAARGITAPILRLVEACRLIGERRFREVTVSEARGDELGELSRSLGQMSSDLSQSEEKIAKEEKLRGDLGRFMSKPLVDAIVRGEHSLALGGERREVSVLFADVVGFTPLAEGKRPEQVVKLLNELFSVLSEIVFRHEGTVDKFIGDCVMAVFGAPVATPDHAARALAAAEDMMRFLETANEDWKERYDVEIRLGVGVNSGEALVGNIGSDKRMEYTVIGDVVNVAARLESIATPNQVLVAAATQKLAQSKFVLRKLGTRRLTGRKDETEVFELSMD